MCKGVRAPCARAVARTRRRLRGHKHSRPSSSCLHPQYPRVIVLARVPMNEHARRARRPATTMWAPTTPRVSSLARRSTDDRREIAFPRRVARETSALWTQPARDCDAARAGRGARTARCGPESRRRRRARCSCAGDSVVSSGLRSPNLHVVFIERRARLSRLSASRRRPHSPP